MKCSTRCLALRLMENVSESHADDDGEDSTPRACLSDRRPGAKQVGPIDLGGCCRGASVQPPGGFARRCWVGQAGKTGWRRAGRSRVEETAAKQAQALVAVHLIFSRIQGKT